MHKSSKLKIILLAELVLIALLFSNSCGLGINYRITGVSPAQDGLVRIYTADRFDNQKLLTSTTLKDNQLQFVSSPQNKIIRLTLERFTVFDFIKDNLIDATSNVPWETLIAYPDYSSNNQMFNINPITTISVALAVHKINNEQLTSSEEIKDAIDSVVKTLNKHFGDLNILETIPASLDVKSNKLTSNIKYSLLLAAFTELPHHYNEQCPLGIECSLNITTMTKMIYDDLVFDGILDGIAEYGTTPLNLVTLPDKSLKADLALSIYRIINNPSLNKTELSAADIKVLLDRLCLSKASFFKSNSVSFEFDNIPPVINCSSPLSSSTLSGAININCDISDELPGIESTDVIFSGDTITNRLTTPNSFFAIVNTEDYPNGYTSIVISSKDRIGNLNSTTIPINIDN